MKTLYKIHNTASKKLNRGFIFMTKLQQQANQYETGALENAALVTSKNVCHILGSKGFLIGDLERSGSLFLAQLTGRIVQHIAPCNKFPEIHAYKSSVDGTPYSFTCGIHDLKQKDQRICFADATGVYSDARAIMDSKANSLTENITGPQRAAKNDLAHTDFARDSNLLELGLYIGRLLLSSRKNYTLSINKLDNLTMERITRSKDSFLNDSNTDTIQYFFNSKSADKKLYKVSGDWYFVSVKDRLATI